MNIIVQTFLGLFALLGGVILLYLFMAGLSTSVNLVFLILSLVFLCGASFLFIRVSKITNSATVLKDTETIEGGSKLLAKNNQLIKDYSQSNNKKDNLKAVQIAVSAEATAVAEEGK